MWQPQSSLFLRLYRSFIHRAKKFSDCAMRCACHRSSENSNVINKLDSNNGKKVKMHCVLHVKHESGSICA